MAVADFTGDWPALSVVERLADLGLDVTVLTPPAAFAWRTTIYSTLATSARLRARAVRVRPLRRPVRWDGETLTVEDLSSGETEDMTGLSAVIVADHDRAAPGLWPELRARGLPARRIGDANAPRTALEAIYSGHQAAREIA